MKRSGDRGFAPSEFTSFPPLARRDKNRAKFHSSAENSAWQFLTEVRRPRFCAALRCGVLCSRWTRPYLARREFQIPPSSARGSFLQLRRNAKEFAREFHGNSFPRNQPCSSPLPSFEGKFEGRRSILHFFLISFFTLIRNWYDDQLWSMLSQDLTLKILSRWVSNMAVNKGECNWLKILWSCLIKFSFVKGRRGERLKRSWKF